MDQSLIILIHALVIVVFFNRYLAGWLFKSLRGSKFDEVVDHYEPEVCVVIPMFNEGAAIKSTIQSLLDQDYPESKLSIVVVDDCSTDDSYRHAMGVARLHSRVTVTQNPRNMGKRLGINRAVRMSTAEIIVSVDSDVTVAPDAIPLMLKRFVSPEIAAVGGRVDVRNKHVNWLTKMQTVKYFFGYAFMKNLERSFRSVMCLSGCLTAYRRSVLMELEPILENRTFLGMSIKYGEDRFLTRQIIKAGHQTTMTNDALCYTDTPETLSAYFSQQLRWRRSNLVDYLAGLTHIWKLNPVVAVHFVSLFALMIAYPALIIGSLLNGSFWPLMTLHAGIVVFFGCLYAWMNKDLPKENKVGILDFLPVCLVMPVTYAVLTPAALFSLDSGSWETRGHQSDDEEEPSLDHAPSYRPMDRRPTLAPMSKGVARVGNYSKSKIV